MSYARFADDSDVYVYFSTSDCYECCMCGLRKPDFMPESTAEMLAHLREHVEAGHKVPADCIEEIASDACPECDKNVDSETADGCKTHLARTLVKPDPL